MVYTGTHDNPTSLEWLGTLNDYEKEFVGKYVHSDIYNPGGFVWDFIREAYRSVADTCINRPGSTAANWQWRLEPHFLSHELAGSIYALTETYGRLPKEEK